MQRQDTGQAITWLAAIVQAEPQSIRVLPVSCLCELLLVAVPTSHTLSSAAAVGLADQLDRIVKALKAELDSSTMPDTSVSILNFFFSKLCSMSSSGRLHVKQALLLILPPPPATADETPLLRRVAALRWHSDPRAVGVVAGAVKDLLERDTDPAAIEDYVDYLQQFQLADAALCVSQLLLQRKLVASALVASAPRFYGVCLSLLTSALTSSPDRDHRLADGLLRLLALTPPGSPQPVSEALTSALAGGDIRREQALELAASEVGDVAALGLSRLSVADLVQLASVQFVPPHARPRLVAALARLPRTVLREAVFALSEAVGRKFTRNLQVYVREPECNTDDITALDVDGLCRPTAPCAPAVAETAVAAATDMEVEAEGVPAQLAAAGELCVPAGDVATHVRVLLTSPTEEGQRAAYRLLREDLSSPGDAAAAAEVFSRTVGAETAHWAPSPLQRQLLACAVRMLTPRAAMDNPPAEKSDQAPHLQPPPSDDVCDRDVAAAVTGGDERCAAALAQRLRAALGSSSTPDERRGQLLDWLLQLDPQCAFAVVLCEEDEGGGSPTFPLSALLHRGSWPLIRRAVSKALGASAVSLPAEDERALRFVLAAVRHPRCWASFVVHYQYQQQQAVALSGLFSFTPDAVRALAGRVVGYGASLCALGGGGAEAALRPYVELLFAVCDQRPELAASLLLHLSAGCGVEARQLPLLEAAQRKEVGELILRSLYLRRPGLVRAILPAYPARHLVHPEATPSIRSDLDEVLHKVVLQLLDPNGHAAAASLCRTIAILHPLLVLRNLPTICAMIAGRTGVSTSEFVFRQYHQLYGYVLSVLDLLRPAVFKNPCVYGIVESLCELFGKVGVRDTALRSLAAAFAAFLRHYAAAAGTQPVERCKTVLVHLQQIFPDLDFSLSGQDEEPLTLADAAAALDGPEVVPALVNLDRGGSGAACTRALPRLLALLRSPVPEAHELAHACVARALTSAPREAPAVATACLRCLRSGGDVAACALAHLHELYPACAEHGAALLACLFELGHPAEQALRALVQSSLRFAYKDRRQ
eukprot:TRINITY_DN7375_c0_g1_i2.p1 TRINITY_DN7375_c0_g1~~TRINITY_DN7375_c0_g1_i2.p1  ORF type:complete len:1051 (-),score=242.67 TRINITY_DN7375_c0_g1_i2:75-3227(-)